MIRRLFIRKASVSLLATVCKDEKKGTSGLGMAVLRGSANAKRFETCVQNVPLY